MTPKRKKKAKLTALKKKLWDIVSRIKRQLYADHRGMVSCVTCGEQHPWKEMQAAHYVEKAKGLSVYFEWTNIHPACPTCNVFKKEEHKRKYSLWMCDTYGRGEVDRLEALAHTQLKITRVEYEEMIEFFSQCEKEL